MQIKAKVVGRGFNSTGAAVRLEVVGGACFASIPNGDLAISGLDPEAVKEYGLGAEFYIQLEPVKETPQVTE